MDRLPAVIAVIRGGAPAVLAAAVVALGACDSAKDAPAPPPRTNGARVTTGQAASPEAFCDVHADDAGGAAFHWPELAGDAAPAATGTWRWVNLWATWCKPCIAEMPRLAAWRDKLAASGRRVELRFVSIDDSDAEVAAYRKDHPGAPPSLRIAGNDQRVAWLKSLRVPDGAIPIHLFVSPAGKLRCARSGEVREQDFAVVDKLLAE